MAETEEETAAKGEVEEKAPEKPSEAEPTKQSGESKPSGETSPAKQSASEAAPDWRDRRLAQQTAKRREAEEREAALRAELERYKAGSGAGAGEASTEEIKRQVEARAAQMASEARFTEACNAVFSLGKQEFPDFPEKVSAFGKLVDAKDPSSVASYYQFLDAAIQAGDAHRIVYELGSDLNEAARIMALSPVKMGVELAKMAGKKPSEAGSEAAPTGGSRAPKPITPVGGKGGVQATIDPMDPERADKLTIDEWMRRRNEQVAERGKRR